MRADSTSDFSTRYDHIPECKPNGKVIGESTVCNVDFILVSDNDDADQNFNEVKVTKD